jgi:hypothetical protein
MGIPWDWLTHDAAGFFTLCIAIIGGVQLWLFYWELRLIRENLADAKEAADGARDSAVAATRQAKAAEDTLVKRERPYLFVFGLSEIQREEDPLGAYFVEYRLANYGPMPAIIESAWVVFETSDCAEPSRPLLVFREHQLAARPILPTGELRVIKEYFPDNMIVGEGGIIEHSGKDATRIGIIPVLDVPCGHDLFFKAVIKYHGPFSAEHETGVEWIYRAETDGFIGGGGPERNYIR